MESKILATFHPQAWINDCAVEVDPEGPTEFDVSAEVRCVSDCRLKVTACDEGRNVSTD